ncbi:MAG: GDL motif peptide-associated radical SAM/SPASM maturase [Verrucomicrobia bacterium]|nr:GDL motif peptide-associated radical SAM/SPASM maturase [Verrucomicrobiota bacterium]
MNLSAEVPPRYCSAEDERSRVPVHVVWELTLACDLKCLHCGSRAGRRRASELGLQECLEVVDSFARLGTREVSLIGGEAYLRRDLPEIVRAIRSHGIYCGIQTGGRHFTPELMERVTEAGLNGLGVSIDGLEPLHDKLRGVPGSFRAALDTLRRAKIAGLRTSVNTQIGSETLEDLPGLLPVIIDAGAKQWQVQLTVPMGNAADREELLLQPYQLLQIMPALAGLYHEAQNHGLLLIAGNNIGYFGPYEHLWRGYADESQHWTGCAAGRNVLALESDGTVKGCPSLSTVAFAGGNVRHLSLESIWQRDVSARATELWGFCQTCYYADVCLGGCTWMTHSLLGRSGNNPYCHHRAIELAKQGLRERIVKTEAAEPKPFATGRFDILVECSETAEPGSYPSTQLDGKLSKPRNKESPERLVICRACNAYVRSAETTCPQCGASILIASQRYAEDSRRRRALLDEIKGLIASHDR